MRSLASSMCQEWTLSHPPSFHPEDLLNFVYLDEFASDWRSIYPNDDDEMSLWALEIAIMSNPEGADVIPGTGRLRKLRFVPADENVGKSGGSRICYAYFPEHHIVLMVMAYPKSQKENLTAEEKQAVKEYLNFTKKWLDNHS